VLLSVNGKGHRGSAKIGVFKPTSTAKVRSAFLFVATTRWGGAHINLNGQKISTWKAEATNRVNWRLSFTNYYADVTEMIRKTVDDAPEGELFIGVLETSNRRRIEGEVLAVIFEDPEVLVPDNSVSLLFGALQSGGDEFIIKLASPITDEDLKHAETIINFSIGISYGYQSYHHRRQYTEVVSGRLS
jgi:hypothetical protein